MKRYFKDLFFLLFYFSYRWLIQVLPFQISYQIAALLGNIRYLLISPRQKRQFVANLDLVFGNRLNPREKKNIIRRFYINQQKWFVDLFIMGRKDYEKYIQACTDDDITNFDKVLSREKGVVGVNFHFSSINLSAVYSLYHGYKVTPLLVLAHIKGVSPWVSEQVMNIKSSIWKERGNFQIITSSNSLVSVVRNQYRCLSQNQIISAAGDGALGGKFTVVDFFNIKLKAPIGPAHISAKSGAAIVPSFAIRRKDNAHHFVFKEPIKIESEDAETLKRVIQEYIKHLEYYISQHPDHWRYWTRIEVEEFRNGIPVIRLVPGIDE